MVYAFWQLFPSQGINNLVIQDIPHFTRPGQPDRIALLGKWLACVNTVSALERILFETRHCFFNNVENRTRKNGKMLNKDAQL